MMTDADIQEIVSSVEPETVDQEPVYGGFRPLQRRYVHENGVLMETIEYEHGPESDAWSGVKNVTYSDGDANQLPVFRSWNISDHPTIPGIYRKVDGIIMKIEAPTILLMVAVKHFNNIERTEPAPYASKCISMFATDEMIVDVSAELQAQGAPAQMGERAYWDFLTGLGMTPYNLLDNRIPELDGLGRFNSIY